MGDGTKRYYWIKLNENFFDLPTVDFLQEQKNGCEYIVLYLKLCLLSANTNGVLVRHIGEMTIPYDTKKIADVTRFKYDTVVVALEAFRRTGLIEEREDGILTIPGIGKMIGSETAWAEKKRVQREIEREKKKLQKDSVPKLSSKNETKTGTNAKTPKRTSEGQKGDSVQDNFLHSVPDNFPQDVSDNFGTNGGTSSEKRLDIRDLDIKTGGGNNARAGAHAHTHARTRALLEENDGESVPQNATDSETAGIVALFENVVHPVSNQAEGGRLIELVRDYGAEWMRQAILATGISGGKTVRYVEAILARWKTVGTDKPWEEDKKIARRSDKRTERAAKQPDETYSGTSDIDWSKYDNTYKPPDELAGGVGDS